MMFCGMISIYYLFIRTFGTIQMFSLFTIVIIQQQLDAIHGPMQRVIQPSSLAAEIVIFCWRCGCCCCASEPQASHRALCRYHIAGGVRLLGCSRETSIRRVFASSRNCRDRQLPARRGYVHNTGLSTHMNQWRDTRQSTERVVTRRLQRWFSRAHKRRLLTICVGDNQ